MLPKYPTGSLTIHHKSAENSLDNVDGKEYVEINKSEKRRVEPSKEFEHVLSACKTMKDNKSKTDNSSRCRYSWPGQKLLPVDPDYVAFNDKENLFLQCNRTCKKRYSTCESDSFKKRKRKTGRDDTKSISGSVVRHPPCDVSDDNIPPLIISESSPEQEDNLLRREMKIWEPLIRTSTSYVRKDGNTEEIEESC